MEVVFPYNLPILAKLASRILLTLYRTLWKWMVGDIETWTHLIASTKFALWH